MREKRVRRWGWFSSHGEIWSVYKLKWPAEDHAGDYYEYYGETVRQLTATEYEAWRQGCEVVECGHHSELQRIGIDVGDYHPSPRPGCPAGYECIDAPHLLLPAG